MKTAQTTLILSILFFSFTTNSATIKVLFDNTKAEQAGNADWVVDGNSQIPSPAQSGITSSTAETYWNGGLSAWGVDCAKEGYTVETLPSSGKITYGQSSNTQDLSKYNIFIVCEPNSVFSSAEKTAIINFVQNGGGLFMVSDHNQSDRNNDGWDSPNVWNDLLSNNTVKSNPFGITFDLASFSQTTSNVAALPNDSILHGKMGNVTQAMWSVGTSMTLDKSINPSVVGKIFKTGSSNTGSTNVMFATARFGKGKVAAIGDSSPCDDGTGASSDQLYDGYFTDANGNHQRLLMNATIWLATPSTATGIESVSKECMKLSISSNPIRNKMTTVRYNLNVAGNTKISLSNLTGKLIKLIDVNNDLPGQHNIQFDLSDQKPGIYILSVDNTKSKESIKICIL